MAQTFVLLILCLFCNHAYSSFFWWHIVFSHGSKIEKVVNWDGALPYSAHTKEWNCKISQPKGFRVNGKADEYQEGVRIECSSIANPKLGVTEYGACLQRGGKRAENSGPRITLIEGEIETWIAATCSSDKWSD